MRAYLPNRLSLYLGRNVFATTLLVGAVLLGFMLLVDFASELQDVGKESYSLSHAAMYIIFSIPRRCYDLFPYVSLIGALMALGRLAGGSELTAMRAVGLSKLQIGVGALWPLLLITVLMIISAEAIAPAAEQMAQTMANAKSKQLMMSRYSYLWVREGNVFLNARGGSPRIENGKSIVELNDVRLFEFDTSGKLVSLAHAKNAMHQDGQWTLNNVERTRFLPSSVSVEKLVKQRWNTELDEKSIESTLSRPRYLSVRELNNNIDYLRRNKLDAVKLEETYWGRWFYPIKVIVLCLATLPFAFGSLRTGGFGKRLFLGILIGIGYMLTERMVVQLAGVYHVDVRFAYLASPILLLLVCWGWLSKRI